MNIQALLPIESRFESQLVRRDLLTIIGGSLFIALLAQIKIPLFFTPVPLSLQTFGIMLIGAFLGSKRGGLAALLYLAQISFGLPFAAGGVSNPLALAGITGGYLIAMGAQAFLIGMLFESRKSSSPQKLIFQMLLISVLQLGFGALWLALFAGMKSALALGFIPFLPGELLKCVATILLTVKVCRLQD